MKYQAKKRVAPFASYEVFVSDSEGEHSITFSDIFSTTQFVWGKFFNNMSVRGYEMDQLHDRLRSVTREVNKYRKQKEIRFRSVSGILVCILVKPNLQYQVTGD